MVADTVGCVGSSILTASGRYFDFDNPLTQQITIDDIAKALSNTCRFGGHCSFYSVAEHSIHCARLAVQFGAPIELQFHALMHDAVEAYVGDLPKPLKNLLPEYSELESAVEAVVFAKFGIDSTNQDEVKRLDYIMLKAEKRKLFPQDKTTWTGFEHLPDVDVDVQCWEPGVARLLFLNWFKELEQQRYVGPVCF